jgi:hypothetical protein
MIWLILAVLIVGYYIVKAVNRNTANNVLIAQQQYLNSTEYRKQQQASMAYWQYLNDALQWQIWIAETKIELLNPPSKYSYLELGKSEPIVIHSRSEVVKYLKGKLRDYQRCLDECKREYEKGKAEYAGYYPESLEVMKAEYDLDIPFDYEGNYELASHWSMYEERKDELNKLTQQLAILEQHRNNQNRLIQV